MNTSDTSKYIKGNLSLIYASSVLIAILMTVASIAGLLYRTSIYPSEELVRSFVPNDVVMVEGEVERLSAKGSFLGRHILTGPVYVEGAERGDALAVEVLDIKFRTNWGWNAQRPLAGTAPSRFHTRMSSIVPVKYRGSPKLVTSANPRAWAIVA